MLLEWLGRVQPHGLWCYVAQKKHDISQEYVDFIYRLLNKRSKKLARSRQEAEWTHISKIRCDMLSLKRTERASGRVTISWRGSSQRTNRSKGTGTFVWPLKGILFFCAKSSWMYVQRRGQLRITRVIGSGRDPRGWRNKLLQRQPRKARNMGTPNEQSHEKDSVCVPNSLGNPITRNL